MQQSFIRLKGVRTHNLKNIDLDIPKNKLVIITGLSGSGKSSLAFDTLYAEGQRRYVESLSSYIKQFLHISDKPDFDSIEGLSPTIAIDQKSTSHNPRSTVGTVTEIYDYLRLLFSRVGTPHCPTHKNPLRPQSLLEMFKIVQSKKEGSTWMLLSPLVRGRKGEYHKLLEQLRQKGFTRVRIDGEIYLLDGELPSLSKKQKHNIAVIVDRFKISSSLSRQRVFESLETSLSLSGGLCYFIAMKSPFEEQLFSNRYACPDCDFTVPKLEPSFFSFNSPNGACQDCDGLGLVERVDGEKVLANPKLSLSKGALRYWGPTSPYYYNQLEQISSALGFSLDTPFEALLDDQKKTVLYGHETLIEHGRKKKAFEGVIPNLQRRYLETDSNFVRSNLHDLMSTQHCRSCDGMRLSPIARNVKLSGHTLSGLTALSIKDTLKTTQSLSLTTQEKTIAAPILREVNERLTFLNEVGLHYLSLNRSADTLSGGEAQRIRLASQIGSGLTGVIYVLDEPSIGLHQRDNQKLLKTLKRLRDLGNSVIVVEHDEEAMESADYIIDIGPHSGVHGGQVCAKGTYQEILKQSKDSHTARHLNGEERMFIPQKRIPLPPKKNWLTLKGATGNNLKGDTLSIPLGVLTAITGVSGSGKSTLINQTLYPALFNAFGRGNQHACAPFESLSSLAGLEQVVRIDQSPIGRTPRSNPATYTGVFTDIRTLMSSTEEARIRGYSPGRFSFNVKGGRCESCQGAGVVRVEMHFMSDVYVTCDSCLGKRYESQTLEILYRGKSIDDILNMTVEEAGDFFQSIPNIFNKLNTLNKVGLSYLHLGHSATHLSGGEAQRVKLASELARRSHGKTFYILDEPTTGLHFHDVKNLMEILLELRGLGNSILVIEHNLDVIKMADHIIDLGPEGGQNGGEIIATGTPESLSLNKSSHTGAFLKELIAKEQLTLKKKGR